MIWFPNHYFPLLPLHLLFTIWFICFIFTYSSFFCFPRFPRFPRPHQILPHFQPTLLRSMPIHLVRSNQPTNFQYFHLPIHHFLPLTFLFIFEDSKLFHLLMILFPPNFKRLPLQ